MNKLVAPDKVKQQQVASSPPGSRIMTMQREEHFSGPIPPPAILKGYESICPGAAHRIIRMAEKQELHRHTQENNVISSKISNEKRGMNYAFVLTLVLVTVGAMLVALDKDIPGYLALFGPSLFHAGNYVYFKSTDKKRLEEKDDQIRRRDKQ